MAKKKQSQTLVTPSAAKKSSEVASTSKKPLGVTSPVKKQSGVTSPVKKPSEAASLAKKPLEVVASTSKKPLKETSTTAKKMQPEPVKNPPPESSSDSEEESDSSSEEEDESSKDFEPTTKTPTTDAVVVSSPNKKRQSEGEPSTEVKRAKTETETETAKKPPFQRLWSEEDEIVLLQGMIDFSSDTGKSVSDDMNGFFEKLKDSISFDVKGVNQFVKKIWSLKNKYVVKKKSGNFTKDHDKKCFELANMIWGSDVDATLVKSTKKIKVDDSLKVDVVNVECDWFERSFIVGAFKNLGAGVDEETLKEKWYLVPVRTRKMIEEKIKSVQANEIKLVLQKLDVLHEVSSMMANSD
ncbi:probable transcription factor At4g00610 isoform X2 [Arabidopsis lyrata subsp. lyrata]|uniref:probable transcription factor At4g00610 isoform X2 n=1 Tax=Arabidopsis lyrata subsp. lyrata TaxID=81972 RepID=UPI000A29B428|nr:probable transcription factor At4g00610 isoform X2 [Arabidopsis lyrata subsp. lyrata]|eukprot:XP_020871018.1 probable transcription factor At4g00610 isoform X2 [Arabidopsis lyrata subsp. lyrata]